MATELPVRTSFSTPDHCGQPCGEVAVMRHPSLGLVTVAFTAPGVSVTNQFDIVNARRLATYVIAQCDALEEAAARSLPAAEFDAYSAPRPMVPSVEVA